MFDDNLFTILDRLKVQYVDNRTTGAFLWIIDSDLKHTAIEAALKKFRAKI